MGIRAWVLSALCMWLGFLTSGAQASDKPLLRIRITTPEAAAIGSISGSIEATNTAQSDLYASVKLSGEASTVVCAPFLVPAGETRACAFTLQLANGGAQTIRLIVAAEATPGGSARDAHPYAVYFKPANGALVRTTYQDLFMGDCLAKRTKKCSGHASDATGGTPSLDMKVPSPFGIPSASVSIEGAGRGPAGEAARRFTISGQLSYLDLQRQLRPGWSWTVTLDWLKPNGQRVPLASDTVASDGTWRVAFRAPLGYRGQNLSVSYAPANSFVTFLADVETPGGWVTKEYIFSDPLRTDIRRVYAAPPTTIDLSDQGQYAGLGDVFLDTMLLWNALRSAGIVDDSFGQLTNVVFPNLHYDCGGDEIWSCQYGDTVWVRAADATTPFTMLHELGHALTWRFWAAYPPNSGGDHSWYRCGTAGMALSEGFATAIAAMVSIPLDQTDAAIDDSGWSFPVEEPRYAELTGCSAASYAGSELAVAATIWDLVDRHVDERNQRQDARAYENPYLPIYLILRNGAAASLDDYRDVLKTGANSEVDKAWIDDVFEMNDMR